MTGIFGSLQLRNYTKMSPKLKSYFFIITSIVYGSQRLFLTLAQLRKRKKKKHFEKPGAKITRLIFWLLRRLSSVLPIAVDRTKYFHSSQVNLLFYNSYVSSLSRALCREANILPLNIPIIYILDCFHEHNRRTFEIPKPDIELENLVALSTIF